MDAVGLDFLNGAATEDLFRAGLADWLSAQLLTAATQIWWKFESSARNKHMPLAIPKECTFRTFLLYVFQGPFFAQLRRHKSMYNPKNLAERKSIHFTLLFRFLYLRLKSGACALLPMAWPTPSTTGSRGSRSAVLAVLRRQGEQGSIAVVNLAGGVFWPEAKGWMGRMDDGMELREVVKKKTWMFWLFFFLLGDFFP